MFPTESILSINLLSDPSDLLAHQASFGRPSRLRRRCGGRGSRWSFFRHLDFLRSSSGSIRSGNLSYVGYKGRWSIYVVSKVLRSELEVFGENITKATKFPLSQRPLAKKL